jgi:hypothetical protein
MAAAVATPLMLDRQHAPGDVVGRLRRLLRRLLHLVRHHREPLAGLTRTGSLDGRVERQEVRLLSDRGDGPHDLADLLRGGAELGDCLRRGLGCLHGGPGHPGGLGGVLGDLVDRGTHLPGTGGNGLDVPGDLLGRRLRRLGGGPDRG